MIERSGGKCDRSFAPRAVLQHELEMGASLGCPAILPSKEAAISKAGEHGSRDGLCALLFHGAARSVVDAGASPARSFKAGPRGVVPFSRSQLETVL